MFLTEKCHRMTALKASRRRSSKQKTLWRQRLVLIFLYNFPIDTFMQPANFLTSPMVSLTISGPKFKLKFSFISVPDLKTIEVVASNRCECLNQFPILQLTFILFSLFLTTFCIRYPPKLIAAFSIHLSSQWSKYKVRLNQLIDF